MIIWNIRSLSVNWQFSIRYFTASFMLFLSNVNSHLELLEIHI